MALFKKLFRSSGQGSGIQEVEVFFEPGGFVKAAISGGSTVSFLNDNGVIQKAIASADEHLSLSGELVRFAQGRSFEAKSIDEMNDDGWARFIGGRSRGRAWERWHARTSQGRWNVVFYRGG